MNRLSSARSCTPGSRSMHDASESPTCASPGFIWPVRDGERQDGLLQCACATSTSLVRAEMSAVRPIRLACPPIHALPCDLAGRERENGENTDSGGRICPVEPGMRITDENAARVVHPNPKLNSNSSEPDYGLSSQWNASHFFQPAPGPVSFYLAMTMTYDSDNAAAAAAAVRSWQPAADSASSPSSCSLRQRSTMWHRA